MDEQTRGEHNIEVEVDLDEFRVFPPSAEFASRANVGPEIYAEAAADPALAVTLIEPRARFADARCGELARPRRGEAARARRRRRRRQRRL